MARRFILPLLFLLLLAFSACAIQPIPTGESSGEIADTSPSSAPPAPAESSDVSLPEPSSPAEVSHAPDGKVICIDPGHGFGDPGAQHENLQGHDEKDITLRFSLLLRDVLEERGYTVILTRTGDTASETDETSYTMTPTERAEFANAHNPDYYISLHCNSFPEDSSVSGTRLFYFSPTNEASAAFASALSDALAAEMQRDCRLYDMDAESAYTVIQDTLCPSVLVEMAFITNPTDASDLLSEEWRTAFVKALADGLDAITGGNAS